METNIKLTKREIDLIEFLYNHKLESEICLREKEIVEYLNSINGNYKLMFEVTSSYHDDDRLMKEESLIIISLYKKFGY
ncbi:MAG: hypothetical protein KAW56_01745 [Candidatus Marinimicrobia bacterium]|nr:hypothetical protein [Candidatus Neomarinimicrobiota bacterium]